MENQVIDLESIKLDAVMQLKTWQKKMHTLVEKTYATRLSEIDEMVLNLNDQIQEKQTKIHDRSTQEEIDQLTADFVVKSNIPEDFQQLLERTIRIKHDDEDDDDDLVVINIVKDEEITGEQMAVVLPTTTNSESRISRILNSRPVQQALTGTLTQMTTLAITSPTTIAATSMAKTALFTTACGLGTVACGMGKIAMGTTQKVWSYVTSSDT